MNRNSYFQNIIIENPNGHVPTFQFPLDTGVNKITGVNVHSYADKESMVGTLTMFFDGTALKMIKAPIGTNTAAKKRKLQPTNIEITEDTPVICSIALHDKFKFTGNIIITLLVESA